MLSYAFSVVMYILSVRVRKYEYMNIYVYAFIQVTFTVLRYFKNCFCGFRSPGQYKMVIQSSSNNSDNMH